LKACVRISAVLAIATISGAAEARGSLARPIVAAAPTSGFATARAETPSSGGDVVAEAARWLGSRNMTGPWRPHFASYILQKTGHRPFANGLASSALAYGKRLADPKIGALAVVTTRIGYAAHVDFIANFNADGSIDLISGNLGAARVGRADSASRGRRVRRCELTPVRPPAPGRKAALAPIAAGSAPWGCDKVV
jgi:hypothetical protein